MKKLFQVAALLILAALSALSAVGVAVVGSALSNLAAPRLASRQAGYFGPIYLPPFQNVVQNGLATIDLAPCIGRAVDRFVLSLGGAGNTKANHTEVKVTANETDIFVDTGARIDSRMQYRGIAAAAAFLTVDFSEIRARALGQQGIGTLDTVSSKIRRLTMSVQLGAAAAAPTLSALALLSHAPKFIVAGKPSAHTGLISRVKARTFNPGAAGEFSFPLEFPRVPHVFIKRVFLFGATVTAGRIVKNDATVWRATAAENNFIQGEFTRVPQANVFCVDFIPDGDLSGMVPLQNARSMEGYMTVSGAGNVDVVTEWVAPLQVG